MALWTAPFIATSLGSAYPAAPCRGEEGISGHALLRGAVLADGTVSQRLRSPILVLIRNTLSDPVGVAKTNNLRDCSPRNLD
ncbi:hypothetical protein GQ607_015653 [Colletotrichum asianum]|uniref:Uncharacterized protein n=1 Tax=Colletotrichum asianum TaxID=702518 RepID=A0A8H3W0Y1_9PEZI|nr:hypothetical protein GQ607_015653 [Colletotrichum asianum]